MSRRGDLPLPLLQTPGIHQNPCCREPVAMSGSCPRYHRVGAQADRANSFDSCTGWGGTPTAASQESPTQPCAQRVNGAPHLLVNIDMNKNRCLTHNTTSLNLYDMFVKSVFLTFNKQIVIYRCISNDLLRRFE